MTVPRTLSHPPELQAGKAAFKALVRAFGGQEAAAEHTGRTQSRLSDFGNPHTPDFPPVEIVQALEAATHGQSGHPHVTRWLARSAGYALVRLPTAAAGDSDWHQAIAAVSRETSESIERVCAALADGKVTAAEVASLRIREEIAEAQERLAALDALAAQAPEEG